MKKENRARLMIISSMAVFGTLAPFVRNISVTSGETAGYGICRQTLSPI
jgi:hypothetical protein